MIRNDPDRETTLADDGEGKERRMGDVGVRESLLRALLLAATQYVYLRERPESAALRGLSRGKHRVTTGGNTRG